MLVKRTSRPHVPVGMMFEDFLQYFSPFSWLSVGTEIKIMLFLQHSAHCEVSILPLAIENTLDLKIRTESGSHDADLAFGMIRNGAEILSRSRF